MQKVYFMQACVSFSSQTNYINTKKKLPGTILALHSCVESEVLHEIKKELFWSNIFMILFLDILMLLTWLQNQ